jgi:hypothetical protein
MATYSAKVMVEYFFEFDGEDVGVDNLIEARDYAHTHFEEYNFRADVYSVDVEEEGYEDEE